LQMAAAGFHKDTHTTHLQLPASIILPASLSRSAYSEKSFEAFINMYAPQEHYRNTTMESKDFVEIISVLNDDALRIAMLALGTMALGKQTGDTNITRQGRGLYSEALIATRRALEDPSRSRSTAVLAIPRVMALFELMFGANVETDNRGKSWLSHTEGEMALILARGAQAYSVDDAAHSLFVDARYRTLLAAIRTRKTSVLNEEIWRKLPWQGRVKTPNDQLLDLMAAIPEILEQGVERDGEMSLGLQRDGAWDIRASAVCWDLHFQLQEWLLDNAHEIHLPITGDTTPVEFPSLEIGVLTVRYWVLALIIYSSLDTALGLFPSDLTDHPDRPHPRQFARLIARSVWYFFQKQFGISGATAVSFPLGNALLYLRHNPQLDAHYILMIKEVFDAPSLPKAIKEYLFSTRKSARLPNQVISEVRRLTGPPGASAGRYSPKFPESTPSEVRFLVWILIQQRLKM
jgi:hypothetical protein